MTSTIATQATVVHPVCCSSEFLLMKTDPWEPLGSSSPGECGEVDLCGASGRLKQQWKWATQSFCWRKRNWLGAEAVECGIHQLDCAEATLPTCCLQPKTGHRRDSSEGRLSPTGLAETPNCSVRPSFLSFPFIGLRTTVETGGAPHLLQVPLTCPSQTFPSIYFLHFSPHLAVCPLDDPN